jgi:hypothetical protein
MQKLTVLMFFTTSATVLLAPGHAQEIQSKYLFGKNSQVKVIRRCGSSMARATQCWRIRRSSSTVGADLYNRNRQKTMPDRPGLDRIAGNCKNAARRERKFVEAGGLLMAGFDPTGIRAALPEFGDQHEVDLLVSDAGFTPVEATMIATLYGAS